MIYINKIVVVEFRFKYKTNLRWAAGFFTGEVPHFAGAFAIVGAGDFPHPVASIVAFHRKKIIIYYSHELKLLLTP